MDKVELRSDIEQATRTLLNICYSVMDAEPGTEEAEALNAVSNALMFLENYLYPEIASWHNEDIYFDDDGA